MLYNIDMHTHLFKNKESAKKYWKVVSENNLLGTAITEYNYLDPRKAYFELLKYKPKDKLLIPGIKILTDSGEVLVFSEDASIYNYSILYEDKVSLKRLIDFCYKKKYLITIAHPFGLISNSATYILGLDRLEKIIKEKKIGVEAYTGTIGYLSYYMHDSFFLRKLRHILDYLELHRFFKTLGLSSFSEYLTHKIDQKSYDVVYKFEAAIKLGKMSNYITAGSGSYNVSEIGSGVLTIELNTSFFDKDDDNLKNRLLLNKIKNKKIKSVGPPGNYTDNLFERSTARKTKIKAYKDLMYLTKRSI
ncbi:MAG: hypothetical protein PHX47_02655 [Candidatus ainarchaeum sp.]|jgi:hypothetical protein|nr:hypothetical protein [Candidatus ainarchaeum sp.]